MDFTTRDRYRHVIEKISKNSQIPEEDAANIVIRLAKESEAKEGKNAKDAHVGFYLIDRGLKQLEKLAKVRFSVSAVVKKAASCVPLMIYTGSIFILTLSLLHYWQDKPMRRGYTAGLWIFSVSLSFYQQASWRFLW